ncbi:DUF4880 domain-containing protein [Zestomonas thermotolerans]|uniref:DUF4880 domain-containing protein n=1 Tax=Zestomonas thermotolerans TaxID=157784 RepID=UPI0023F2DB85|nr:DUF4880 domain-containing protein [Pseudomonas thermotolerans]
MSAVPARVLDEAIAWQLCLGSGEASARDRQAFAGWLAAHPDHARVWQQLGGLDQQLASVSSAPARRALLQSAESRRRRGRLGGTALGLLLSVGLALGLIAQQRPLGDYLADQRTASGEQRELRLEDRSLVRLNSRSALDIDFTADERPWYMDALAMSQPLHFGDYGGRPMQILWALLDVLTIVVLGSGLYLWWVRRRAAVPAKTGQEATA